MKKAYTAQQISNTISYWTKVLESMDKSSKTSLKESENRILFGQLCDKIFAECAKQPKTMSKKIAVELSFSSDSALKRFLVKDPVTHTLKANRMGTMYLNTFSADKNKALTLDSVTFDGPMKKDSGTDHVTYTFFDDLQRLNDKSAAKKANVFAEISVGSHYGDDHSVQSNIADGWIYDVSFTADEIILKA